MRFVNRSVKNKDFVHVRQTSTRHSIAGVYFQYTYSMAFVLCRLIQNKWRPERNSLGLSDLCSAPCADLRDMLKPHFYIECYTGTLVILSSMSAWVSHNVSLMSLYSFVHVSVAESPVYVYFLSHFLCYFHILSITAVRIHNHTVLTTHNSSSVYTNDSAYTNISATVGEALTHVHSLTSTQLGSRRTVLGPIHSCRHYISETSLGENRQKKLWCLTIYIRNMNCLVLFNLALFTEIKPFVSFTSDFIGSSVFVKLHLKTLPHFGNLLFALWFVMSVHLKQMSLPKINYTTIWIWLVEQRCKSAYI